MNQSSGFESAHIDVMSRERFQDPQSRTRRDESIGGFFRNLFNDDDNAYRNYSETARRGTVVTVYTREMPQAERAADILDEHGAVDPKDATAKLRDRGIAETDKDSTLEVIKEDLSVGKKEVTTGGVRLRSRVISKPVNEQIRLREEEIFVDRKAVNRPASSSDLDTFKEGTVTIKETSEVPVVQKSARVVEEVSVGKKANERVETIRENVRETKVDVERDGAQGQNRSQSVRESEMADSDLANKRR